MPEWFTYEWHMEGDPAEFAVDTSYLSKAPHPNRPVLMHIRCEMQQQEPLSGRGRRHIDRIEKKCLKELKALYVGRIQDENRRVMFFYTDRPDRCRALEDIADREKYLYCAVGCTDDPQWDTYLNLLYPDAAKFQTEANRKNIDLYRKNKDCISAARRITFHMHFPVESHVIPFAEEARMAGFAIGDTEFSPELEEPYGIALHRIGSLDKAQVDAYTTDAIYLAERYLGKLLYWDCPVIPKNSPLK
ncbi:MAG: DUF695 domain-containing protein [Clostridia bacterium]|nr:DUF695 domain-containing protein [Clostridia bacterium]MBQ6703192.1 DUF695 domain-containing protein [Clostridia bacterium]